MGRPKLSKLLKTLRNRLKTGLTSSFLTSFSSFLLFPERLERDPSPYKPPAKSAHLSTTRCTHGPSTDTRSELHAKDGRRTTYKRVPGRHIQEWVPTWVYIEWYIALLACLLECI